MAGKTWADVVTVARLEHGLGVPLWPRYGGEAESSTDAAVD
jgi:hypothetical protein